MIVIALNGVLEADYRGVNRPMAAFKNQPDKDFNYQKWHPSPGSKEDKEKWAVKAAVAKNNARTAFTPTKAKEILKRKANTTYVPPKQFIPPRSSN